MNDTARNIGAPEVGAVQQQLATAALAWSQKRVWGTVGMTHYAEVVIGDDVYRYVIDQPRQHQWVARGWVNGSFCLYRDARQAKTLRAMKDVVAQHYGEKLAETKGTEK